MVNLMKFKPLMMLTAILSFVNGIFYFLFPVLSINLLGGTKNPMGIMQTRFAGACALGLGVILWFSKNLKVEEYQRVVAYGILTTLVLSFVINIYGTMSKTVNQIGWLFVISDFVISIGFIWLLRKKQWLS
jgi:hypothetical protein